MNEDVLKELKILAKRRWYSQKRRMENLKLEILSLETYENLLISSYQRGFICVYCNKQMKLKDSYPYKDVASIDHYISLSEHKNNTAENLVVCCHACNIIKGTLPPDKFLEFIKTIQSNPNLKDTLFDNFFKYKLPHKLKRIQLENKLTKREDINKWLT